MGVKEANISIRKARPDDSNILWNWANDPSVRLNSINQGPISWDTHVRWFKERLCSLGTRFWIMECAGEPVGQIRYDKDDDGDCATISFSVASEYRGKGYGSKLIERTRHLACSELGVQKIAANTLVSNIASYRAFINTGFRMKGVANIGGHECYQFQWEPDEAHLG